MINGLSASALVSWQRSNRVKNDRKPGFWPSLWRVCSVALKPGNEARQSRTIFQGIFPFWAEVIALPFGWITCGILGTNLEKRCTQWELQKYYALKTHVLEASAWETETMSMVLILRTLLPSSPTTSHSVTGHLRQQNLNFQMFQKNKELQDASVETYK